MKIVLMLTAVVAASVGAVVIPVVRQTKVVSKTSTPEQLRAYYAGRERVNRVLEAFRRGDSTQETAARETMKRLPISDERRFEFARVLIGRGQTGAAYDLIRPKAHFGEFNLPNDQEMVFYAHLAEQTGHPGEAAWALDRIGEDGHFRVWMRGERYVLGHARHNANKFQRQNDQQIVNFHMGLGLEHYPSHRKEIEALRRELLSAQ